jgi:hypothetical protein
VLASLTAATDRLRALDKFFAKLLGGRQAQAKAEELRALAQALGAEDLEENLSSDVRVASVEEEVGAEDEMISPNSVTAGPGLGQGGADAADDEGLSARDAALMQRLGALAGLENERLAHELTLDRTFRLPEAPHTNSALFLPASVAEVAQKRSVAISPEEQLAEQRVLTQLALSDPPAAQARMRQHVLRMLGDRLFCAICVSPVTEDDLLDCRPGLLVPLAYAEPQAVEGAVAVAAEPSAKIFTARIDAVHPESRTLDATFVCDGTAEKGVPFARIKTTAAEPSAVLLLQALDDLVGRVLQLVPSR